MGLDNVVIFKGGRDGIIVILDKEAPFTDIKTIFIQKLQDAKHFFSGAKVSMRFSGRILTQSQQDELMEVLSGQNIVNISFLHEFETDQKEEEKESLPWFATEDAHDTSMTKYHVGILRSGQCIEYPGSVVIIGDVNPGAQILAGGNIIVLGTLKGVVHAGRNPGAYRPFVMALGMHPVQIGIRSTIARSPDSMYDKKEEDTSLIAYLSNNQIYIEPVDYKTVITLSDG